MPEIWNSDPVRRTGDDGRREYTLRTGEVYPSVTTILQTDSQKTAPLTRWAARYTAEWAFDHVPEWINLPRDEAVAWLKAQPFEYRDERADIGLTVHDWAEAHILGTTEPEVPPDLVPQVNAFLDFERRMAPRWEAAECVGFNRIHRYAGQIDSIATIAGVRYVLDLKTSRDIYPGMALQVTAYRHSTHVEIGPARAHLPMPHVDAEAILHLDHDGHWSVVPTETGPEDFLEFQNLARSYHWIQQRAPHMLGAPLGSSDPMRKHGQRNPTR